MQLGQLIGLALMFAAGLARATESDNDASLEEHVTICETRALELIVGESLHNATTRLAMHRSCNAAAHAIASMQSRDREDAARSAYLAQHRAVQYGPDAVEFRTYAEQCLHFAGEFDSDLPEADKQRVNQHIARYCTAAKRLGKRLSRAHVGNAAVQAWIKETLAD